MNVKMKRTFLASFLAIVLTACAVFGVLALKPDESPALTENLGTESLLAAKESIETALQKGERVTVMGGGVEYEYLVYGTANHANVNSESYKLASDFFYKFSNKIESTKESASTPTKNVVTYGRVTNVPLSIELADAVDALGADIVAWGIAYKDGVFSIYSNSKAGLSAEKSKTKDAHKLYDDLYAGLEACVLNGNLAVPEDFLYIYTVTADELAQLRAEDEIAYEQEKIALREERKQQLSSMIAALDNSEFDPSGKGYTADLYSLTSKRYDTPDKYPTTGEHPRVYFNADMIPGIKAAMENPENREAVAQLWAYAEEWSTGELGPRVVASGYSHNYNARYLDMIQAKAFAYVLTGDTYYGYGAILMIENFIRTLDFDGKSSDQCREFGNIMYTAACVYDWCHDLLTEDDIFRIISGVQQIVCTGSTPNEDGKIAISSSPVKMEIGFPPTSQGSATGHGSEDQLLRDYLSFAIAIFDEVPGWYELIGGRFYQEYVDIRNAYYSAGLVPQGTGGYNSGRYQSDLHSAVLMLAATGEIPYNADDMREVVYGLLAPLTNAEANKVFYIGDCRPHQAGSDGLSVGTCPMISSYLFDDGLMRGIAKWLNPNFANFSTGTSGLSPVEFLIYSSKGTVTVEDPISALPLVTYNGGWYGQIISRNNWTADAAIVLMKVQEKTTANHDHWAAGTFQIYYKGMLTGDMGDYTGVAYGSEHCVYYMRATIAHNGLLIYNPALASSLKGYYSGGQRQDVGEPTYKSWFSNSGYNTGSVKGYKYAYDSSMNPTFAYIAGDITKAYDSITVDYVGRTMLTVYTDDPTMPMVFFVFDNISADSESFKKTFLLQVPGEQAPVVDADNKTVTVTNGEGKLVLQNVLGGDTFTEIGGNDPTKEAPYNRLNYVVNGNQLHYYGSSYNYKNSNPSLMVPADGESWGRVEISPNTGNKTDYMLNVMYVADEGVTTSLTSEGFKAYSTKDESVIFEGAKFGNIAAIFSTSEKYTSEEFSFTMPGEGLTELYIGGLYNGTWVVSVDGERVGTIYSTGEAAMVNFKAYAGTEITLTPGSDIRPANSGEVNFNLDGGSWVSGKAPFEFYPLGQEKALPDESSVTKNDAIFQGWYSDAEFTNKITSIPADAGENYTVYAKWKVIPTVAYADYSKSSSSTRINISAQAGLSDKPQADRDAAKAIYNATGCYLLWQSRAGGPSIFGTSNYKNYGSTVFSFEFVLSKNGNDPVLVTGLRMRNSDKKDVSLFSTMADGTVKVGDTVLGQIGSTPVSIRFTVDFEQGKIFYFANEYGTEIHVKNFSDPSGKVSNTVDLIPLMLGDEIFSWRANGNGDSVGSLRIHKISVMAEESFRNEAADEIIYNTNGGTFTDGTQSNVPYDKENGTTLSTAITRDGYIFDGWYSDAGFGNKVESVPAGTVGAFPVYAKWVRHEIVYETNGGAFASTPVTAYTPGTAKTLATDISKEGHTFLGWYTTSDFAEGTLVTEVPASASDVYYVFAKWIKNSIVFNTNGGVFSADPPETYIPGEENLLPTNISNGEFIFDGWYTDSECTNKVTSIPTDRIGEFVVYAKWTLEGNKIYYMTDGGEFTSDPVTDYSVSRLLASNIYKEGYSFLGWYTDPECTIETESVPVGYEGAYIVYAKWFKSVIIHDTMDEAGENSYNYVECAGHSDTDNNGICEVCNVCTDIAACHTSGAGATCSKCGRSWMVKEPGNKISSASGNMAMKNYPAVKYTKVDNDGDTALRVDVQYKTDDGLFYVGRNVTTDAYGYFSEGGRMLTNEFVFSIDLAKVEGKTTPTFEIRFFKERHAFLYLNDGKVYNKRSTEEGALIADLTTDLQTIDITFDISNLANGSVTYSVYSPAQGKTLTRTINGTNCNDVLFQWRFNSAKDAAFVFDNIKLTVPAKEAVTNSVVYNTNGGSFRQDPVAEYTPGQEFILPEPTKEGAGFGGWYLTPDFSGEAIDILPLDAVGEVNVYAKWVEYKINYNTDGGAFENEPNLDYSTGSKVLATDIKKEGYTFLGWYTEPGFANKVTEVPADYVGTYTVYACWFKTELVNEDMSGLTVGSVNWKECSNHSDTDNNGICEVCETCTDYDSCRGSNLNAAQTCSKCGRTWTSERLRVKNFKDSGEMAVSKYPAAKATTVTVNGSDALRIDVQKHLDDGTFYIGQKVSSNIINLLCGESGNVIVPTIEFSIDLAKVDGKDVIPFTIRAYRSRTAVLEVKSDGRVFLGGEKDGYLITTLTSEMQTITISIDTTQVASGKLDMSAYSTAQEKSISRQISGTPGAEDCLFQWRFGGAKNAAFIVDNIKLTVPAID